MRSSILALAALTCLAVGSGCATKGGTGALIGSGIGAIAGYAIEDDEGALVGAAIGAGAGYLIGNELDKTQSESHDFSEPTPLSGTRWSVVSLVPMPNPPFVVKTIDFRNDGIVVTRTTDVDGLITETEERYRVVGKTLIVNKPGYLVNAAFAVDGGQLIIDAEQFRAVCDRL